MSKWLEIWEELKTVFSGRGSLFDSIIPPIFFLVLNSAWGLPTATWGSLISVVSISTFRIIRRQSIWFALAGLLVSIIAVGFSYWIGRQEVYYLPSILIDTAMILVFLVSIIFKRPMAAYTSYLIRAWPMGWYWQPKIRPAYTEVTWFWAILFSLRLGIQFYLFQQHAIVTLAWLDVLMGWPFLLVILIVSYLYGISRLQKLGGPSVIEWKTNVPPPWQSQRRGF